MALITKQLLAKPVKMREGEAAVIAVGLHGAVPSTEHPRAWLWACIGLSGSCWKAASGKEDAVREQLKGMNAARFSTGRRCLSLADTYH